MNKVTMLIGNIGSGKSTWLDKNTTGTVIISKDNIRKDFARCINKDYLFDDAIEPYVYNIVTNYFKGVLHLNYNHVVIDETNITCETRSPYIIVAKEFNYIVNAVVFPDLGEEEHIRRRMIRNHDDTISRDKWVEVYRWKKERYEEPTKTEGFDSIIYL